MKVKGAKKKDDGRMEEGRTDGRTEGRKKKRMEKIKREDRIKNDKENK